MFMAFSASLRSADLSRQVGAAIVTAEGDLVAVGANDVPHAGGGLYWPGERDQRDHVRRADPNELRREAILTDTLQRLCPENVSAEEWIRRGKALLKESLLMDITEYGRATHAEMEALLSCARTGIRTRGATLYSTTFPCHNCAKHIITAGIMRVVYVEPYPKSQAQELFRDSITQSAGEREGARVKFEPFVGVGPRHFFDLFSIHLSSGTPLRRKAQGVSVSWSEKTPMVRVPLLPNSYLEREMLAESEIMGMWTDRLEEPS